MVIWNSCIHAKALWWAVGSSRMETGLESRGSLGGRLVLFPFEMDARS